MAHSLVSCQLLIHIPKESQHTHICKTTMATLAHSAKAKEVAYHNKFKTKPKRIKFLKHQEKFRFFL